MPDKYKDEDDSYIKLGMKEENEKVHGLALMRAKSKMGKSKSKMGKKSSEGRVNYPFGSVRKGDPFVKNQSDFLKKMQEMNKSTMKKLDTSKKLKGGK